MINRLISKSGFCRLIILVATLSLFTACKPRESAVDAGARDQMLHIASGAEPQSLDPHIVTGIVESRILQNLFEGLVTMDPVSLEIIPAAAESWNISDDGKTYTFHLRKNLRWSNGDPVTAQDFHYAMQRVLSPLLGNTYTEYFFKTVTNAIAYNNGDMEDFGEVGFKAPNDLTFEIHLDNPNPVLLRYLDQPSFYPVHQATIEAHGTIGERGTNWIRPENMVGNGAFRLTEWGVNTVVSMDPNPHYWDRDAVRLKQVHFYPIENTDTQYRAYQNGQVHVALHIPLHVIMQLEQTLPPDYRNPLIYAVYFYVFNTTRPPFDDLRVRKALSLAIDRKEIVEQVTQGGQIPAYSLVPPNANNYEPAATVTEDVNEARRLLAEAGFPGGEGLPTIEFIYNTADNHKKIAESIQQMWKSELGVNIELVNMEWKVFLDRKNTGDFHLARFGWGSDTDFGGYLSLLQTDSGNNASGWSNKRFDELYEKTTTLMDPDERIKVAQEAEAILINELPVIPIYFYTRNYMVDTRLKNWHSTPTDFQGLKPMYFGE